MRAGARWCAHSPTKQPGMGVPSSPLKKAIPVQHATLPVDISALPLPCPGGGVQRAGDRTAATNVLAAGLAVNAWGGAGRRGGANPPPARPDEAGIPRL